ncbi:flavin reductase family protein [Nocardioides donggukensis]|uniref:Flavin reductase family protein n=1 Tax=Nocardioides donggukensis TaxID=2774019 RepID=A0A927K3H3_9ACTN|nr:flavin reductase family protein [Nocardioides donggukensis]MBD8869347.1 flavin reductase family protein [Nocardioides donggukensis]
MNAFLGSFDFELRPGESTDVAGSEEAREAALRFRDVLGGYCSGVTVVTAVSRGEPVGMTCQSFASISLDPPLVMFSPARTSRAWPVMQRAGVFCVNFLAADQEELATVMASRGADKFAGLPWSPSRTGSPLFEGTVGHVDCTVHAVHEAGDHYVVIGRVQDMDLHPDASGRPPAPLLFHRGEYRTTR